jgi:hypothetical protein
MPGGDEPATRPPLTTEGKNTFGCLIDGRVFVPDMEQLGALRLSIFFEQNSLQLQAKASKESVTVDCEGVTIEGLYKTSPPPFNGRVFKRSSASSDCWHRVGQSNSKIEILYLDRTARIIAGKFEYLSIINPCDSSDILNITEGRFDIQY